MHREILETGKEMDKPYITPGGIAIGAKEAIRACHLLGLLP